ncbi:hypothetical protein BpHYR1_041313 [Brachionus plicatilis]|uniref:Uncharacterized protein n=1 Tax=Brachionus plicatilis TaxID=10195 RepID=A0A3M7P6W2_BRAPC|nr:hypothetical protein BpHYR1_041313 [Brachionus plicatilis]
MNFNSYSFYLADILDFQISTITYFKCRFVWLRLHNADFIANVTLDKLENLFLILCLLFDQSHLQICQHLLLDIEEKYHNLKLVLILSSIDVIITTIALLSFNLNLTTLSRYSLDSAIRADNVFKHEIICQNILQHLFFKNSKAISCGGVAIYVHSDLESFEVSDEAFSNTRSEQVWCDVKVNEVTIMVGCV